MGMKQILRWIPTNRNIQPAAAVTMARGKALAVVVHTCDDYEFCWEGWSYYFQKSWNFDAPCNLYFVNEKKPVRFNNFLQIATGPGAWSDRLMEGLSRVEEENVLYMQEDFWMTKTIDVEKYFAIFCRLEMDAFRLCGPCGYFKLFKAFSVGDTPVARFWNRSSYLVCHQASIWKKSFFLECLEKNETPWMNETDGTLRIRRRKRKARIFISECNWYEATCCKGKLTNEGVAMLQAVR
jgi:hypothetical protein